MKNSRDTQTLDLFNIPVMHGCVAGRCRYSQDVADRVSGMLAEATLDRFEVSAEVSRLSGKDVSKHMLDGYASRARIDHALPFWLAPVFEQVCNSHVLTDWLVEQRGGRVGYGSDALKQELGRLAWMKSQANKDLNSRIKQVEALLGSER